MDKLMGRDLLLSGVVVALVALWVILGRPAVEPVSYPEPSRIIFMSEPKPLQPPVVVYTSTYPWPLEDRFDRPHSDESVTVVCASPPVDIPQVVKEVDRVVTHHWRHYRRWRR